MTKALNRNKIKTVEFILVHGFREFFIHHDKEGMVEKIALIWSYDNPSGATHSHWIRKQNLQTKKSYNFQTIILSDLHTPASPSFKRFHSLLNNVKHWSTKHSKHEPVKEISDFNHNIVQSVSSVHCL